MLTPLKKTPVSTNPADAPISLKPFLRKIGASMRDTPTLQERKELPDPVQLIEKDPSEIESLSKDNLAFIDGVQASKVLGYEYHRPILLSFTSAGAVNGECSPLDLIESLEIVCSEADVKKVTDADCPIAVNVVTDSIIPAEVEKAVYNAVNPARDRLEFLLADQLLTKDPSVTIVADGHLARRPVMDGMVGVVKTTNTKLLDDESVLWSLKQGWRSPTFIVPADFGGGSQDRFSSYVRMRSSANQPWSYGLVRVETYNQDLIPQAAAIAYHYKQHSRTSDPRGDRHILPVARVEKWLKARIPAFL